MAACSPFKPQDITTIKDQGPSEGICQGMPLTMLFSRHCPTLLLRCTPPVLAGSRSTQTQKIASVREEGNQRDTREHATRCVPRLFISWKWRYFANAQRPGTPNCW
eukprot:scpid64726/ scgid14177/ 